MRPYEASPGWDNNLSSNSYSNFIANLVMKYGDENGIIL